MVNFSKTALEIAKLVEGKVIGDQSVIVSGFSSIDHAQKGELTFLSNLKYLPQLSKTNASVILVGSGVVVEGKTVIQTENPSLAFSKIISALFPQAQFHPKGIHSSAVVSKKAILGKNVSVGAHVVIEDEAVIGDDVIIYAGCYVGGGVRIGRQCVLYPNVVLREGTVIGNKVVIHSNTSIGTDGFGYEQVNGKHEKISQIGIVVIEDDVEIGSNVTIDRARFDKTLIGRGTKIDNLVQIAHNVVIGENCIIIAQVGISGSCVIGKNSILAGQAGLAGHLTIGENSIIAAQAGVIKSLPPGSKVSGYPAKPHEEAKIVNAHLQRLPHYVEIIQELQKKVEDLEKQLKSKTK